MEPPITTFPGTSPPSPLLTVLQSHLPYSLNVLRRLQFASRVEGGSSPSAYTISVSSPDSAHFCAAYYDPSRGPETECWVYSTLEDAVPFNTDPESFAYIPPNLPENEVKTCVEQLLLLFRRLAAIEADFTSSCKEHGLPADTYREPGAVRIGACHETIRGLLMTAGVGIRSTGVVPKGKDWEFYAKWLARVDEMTKATELEKGKGLEEGMRWDTVRREDAELIKSRTSIPKRE
ncbi:hypothetical protein DL546_000261 [Coniochaeta pulveracea]|uniref:Uncharacterized protein n=1 Tax=Coniochaeta pulveracea TaxID=177199 RepID=A0A420Y418_9PEZI|nr:hypothetical protein DL546_000261 [Coniochaeta pulveracea]